MKWAFETWRKLYTRILPEWAALPALARGIGSELIKHCDEDGRIPLGAGESPADTVVRVMAAHRGEQKTVRECVKVLLADGYLVLDGGGDAVVIRNLRAAQEPASPAARAAKYRAARASRCRDEPSRKASRESDALRHDQDEDEDLPLTPASGGTDFVTPPSAAGPGPVPPPRPWEPKP